MRARQCRRGSGGEEGVREGRWEVERLGGGGGGRRENRGEGGATRHSPGAPSAR